MKRTEYDGGGEEISLYEYEYEDTGGGRIEYEWQYFEHAPKTGKYNAY